jgi:hypothetical protein
MLRLRDCKTSEDKLKFLKEILEEDIDPTCAGDEANEGYQTAIVMLAAMIEGPDVKCLSNLTNYPQHFIEAIARATEAAKLWSKKGVNYDHWFVGDQLRCVAFWSDVLVAQGILCRTRNSQGEWIYGRVKAC